MQIVNTFARSTPLRKRLFVEKSNRNWNLGKLEPAYWNMSICSHQLMVVTHLRSSIFFVCSAGTKFICNQVIAPIKNESDEVCMYLLTFEDTESVAETSNSSETGAATGRFSKCNSTLPIHPLHCSVFNQPAAN